MGSHPRNIFPFFPVRGSGPPPSTTEYGYSAPTCWPHENNVQCSKRVTEKSTRRSNQVLKLTDYYISQYVASTFKSLIKCATNRNLNIFSLHRRGITSTTTPSIIIILLQNVKSCNSYDLASGRKLLVFYRS